MSEEIEEDVLLFEKAANDYFDKLRECSQEILKKKSVNDQNSTKDLDFIVDELQCSGIAKKDISSKIEQRATEGGAFQRDIVEKYLGSGSQISVQTAIKWIKQVSEDLALFGCMKCFVSDSEANIPVEKQFLFVYYTFKEEWQVLREGYFSDSTNLILKDNVLIAEENNEVVVFLKSEEDSFYKEVNRRKFIGPGQKIIILVDSYISKMSLTVQYKENIFDIETFKYDKESNLFLNHCRFKFHCHINCEWPLKSGIRDKLISSKTDLPKTKNTYKALMSYLRSGNDKGQSHVQFIGLNYERHNMCLFWVHHDLSDTPLVFICYRGKNGIVSQDGKLIGIMDEWEYKFCIWLTDHLISHTCIDENLPNFYSGPLCKLTTPIEIDIKERNVIMFEMIPKNNFNTKYKIITLLDDFSFTVWEQDPLKNASVNPLFEVSTSINDISTFTFVGQELIIVGRNNDESNFVWNYDAHTGACTHKFPYLYPCGSQTVFVGAKKGFLFFLTDNELQKLEYSFKSSIFKLGQSGENGISFVGLSPTGKWLVYKIREGKGSLAKDFYALLNYENKEKVVIDHKDIVQFCVSTDDDYVACATIKKELIFQNMKVVGETVYSLKKIADGKIDIDFSGNFTDKIDSDKRRMWMSKEEILTVVGKDKTEGVIYAVWFKLSNERFLYKEIGRVLENRKLSGTVEIKETVENEERWLHCVWEFSQSGRNLLFYFLDEEQSKVVVWDCYNFSIMEYLFPFTVLKKNIPVFKRQSSKLKKPTSTSSLLIKTDSNLDENDLLYAMPDIWFEESGKMIILFNSRKSSFFVANCKTSQKDIDLLIAQESSRRLKMVQVTSDGNIYFALDDGGKNNRIIKRVEIEKIPTNLEDKYKAEIYMRFPLPKGHKKNKPGFEERLIISADTTVMIHIVSDSRGESNSGARATLWNPDSSFTSSLLDYSIIKYLREDKPSHEDVSPLLSPYLVNRVDRQGRSLLVQAVEDRNVEVIKNILYWAKERKCLLNFFMYPLSRISGAFSTNQNILRIAIENEDIEIVKLLVSAIADGLVSIEEVGLIVQDCKDDLMSEYRDIFIELVRCVLDQDEEMSIEKSIFGSHSYITVTKDSLICPQWKGGEIEFLNERLFTEEEEKEVYRRFRDDIMRDSVKIHKYDILGLDNIVYAIEKNRGLPKQDIWLYEKFLDDARSEIQDFLLEEDSEDMNADMDQEEYLLTFEEIDKARQKIQKIKLLNNFYSLKDTASIAYPFYRNNEGISSSSSSNSESKAQTCKEIDVVSSVFPWRNAAKVGKEGLLHTLQEYNLEWDTFDALPIKQLIDYKWNSYAKEYVFFSLIFHLIIAIFFTIYSVLLGYEKQDEEIMFYRIFQFFSLFISSAFSLWILIMECVQFRHIFLNERDYHNSFLYLRRSIYKWFHSKWNACEALMFSFITFFIPSLHIAVLFNYNVGKVLSGIVSLTSCLMCWKLLYFFLPYRSTGPLVIMIFEIIKDIMFFVEVVIMLLVGFGTAFFVLFRNSKEESEEIQEAFGNYPVSLISTFGMMLGNYEQNWFILSDSLFLATFLFVLYMVIMLVVFFNLLIAIMGDSFDRIKSKEEISFYIARAEIIKDVESKLLDHLKRRQNENEIKHFLHILRPKSQSVGETGWQGRVEQITGNVREVVKQILVKESESRMKQKRKEEEKIRSVMEIKIDNLTNKLNDLDDKTNVLMQNTHSMDKDPN